MELRCKNCGSVDLKKVDENLFECNFCHTKYIPNQGNNSISINTPLIRNSADRKRLLLNAKSFYTNKDFEKAEKTFNELLNHYPIYMYSDVATEYYTYRKIVVIDKLEECCSFSKKWSYIKEGILLIEDLSKYNINSTDLKEELKRLYYKLNFKDIGEKRGFDVENEQLLFENTEKISKTSVSKYDEYGYLQLWQSKEVIGNYALELDSIKETIKMQKPSKTFIKDHKKRAAFIRTEMFFFIILLILTPALPILMVYLVMEDNSLWMLGFYVSLPIAFLWAVKCISLIKNSKVFLSKEKDTYGLLCRQKELHDKLKSLFAITRERYIAKKRELLENEKGTFERLFQ